MCRIRAAVAGLQGTGLWIVTGMYVCYGEEEEEEEEEEALGGEEEEDFFKNP